MLKIIEIYIELMWGLSLLAIIVTTYSYFNISNTKSRQQRYIDKLRDIHEKHKMDMIALELKYRRWNRVLKSINDIITTDKYGEGVKAPEYISEIANVDNVTEGDMVYVEYVKSETESYVIEFEVLFVDINRTLIGKCISKEYGDKGVNYGDEEIFHFSRIIYIDTNYSTN